MRVKIGEQKKEIPLRIRWAVNKFDHENGLCRQRFPEDQEAIDNNMIIRTQIGKINDLFKYYRLSDIPVTMTRFLYDFHHDFPRKDFIAYMDKRITARYKDHDISDPTRVNHMKAVGKLKSCYGELPFAAFDEKWGRNFDNYLKKNMITKLADNVNGRWAIHKCIKTYIRIAQKDGIHFINPYDFFRIRPGKGSWQAIFEHDFRKLYKYYHNPEIPSIRKKVLRGFIFSCMTGLRISDLARVDKSWIEKNILIFIPYKGRKKNKRLEIPINKVAREMIREALRDHPDGRRLFYDTEEQTANRILKEIGGHLNIKTNLHWHVGRHTFITMLYNKTKDLLAAQHFAGHENISATMVYTHQDRKELVKKMKPMDDII